MKKTKIMALTISALLLMPSAAFAKGNDKSSEKKPQDKPVVESKASTSQVKTEKQETQKSTENVNNTENSKKEAAQQKKEENKQAVDEFKAAIKTRHETMKANTVKSMELKKEIAQKRAKLSSILDAIKEGKLTLTQDELDKLTKAAEALKVAGEKVSSLDEINNEVAETQEQVKGKKFEAALAALDKVIAKQEQRIIALQELSNSLDILLGIAETATPVAEEQTPAPVGQTDTTQPQDTTGSNETADGAVVVDGTQTTDTQNTSESSETSATQVTADNSQTAAATGN